MKSLVILHALKGEGSDLFNVRQSLDRLWSEESRSPNKVVLFAEQALCERVRKDYHQRIEVVETSPEFWLRQLNQCVFNSRCPMVVFLSSGTRVTPGWLKELRDLAKTQLSMVAPCWFDQPKVLKSGVDSSAKDAALPEPSRADLRREATQKRFATVRAIPRELLTNDCLAISRQTMTQLGYLDARFSGLAGALSDYQRRLVASGGKLLQANRVLMSNAWPSTVGPTDSAFLQQRQRFYLALGVEKFSVAVELETDDIHYLNLVTLVDSLVQRGIQVVTFSARTRPEGQPSNAPHLSGASFERLVQGCSLILLRTEGLLTETKVLHLSFETHVHLDLLARGVLTVPKQGVDALGFDEIACAIAAHSKVA